MYEASLEARKTKQEATSSGWPARFSSGWGPDDPPFSGGDAGGGGGGGCFFFFWK